MQKREKPKDDIQIFPIILQSLFPLKEDDNPCLQLHRLNLNLKKSSENNLYSTNEPLSRFVEYCPKNSNCLCIQFVVLHRQVSLKSEKISFYCTLIGSDS